MRIQPIFLARAVSALSLMAMLMIMLGAPAHATETHAPISLDLASYDNLFLADHGTRVVDFSSEYGSGWEVSNLTPSRSDIDRDSSVVRQLIWSSAPNAPFPHWLTYAFDEPHWVTTLMFDNFLVDEADHPGISAKAIEIWAGVDQSKLKLVQSAILKRNQSGQLVEIPPTEARFIKLVIKSNYGHPWYTELNATAAFDKGSRPKVTQ